VDVPPEAVPQGLTAPPFCVGRLTGQSAEDVGPFAARVSAINHLKA
jgi:hypothetical protein